MSGHSANRADLEGRGEDAASWEDVAEAFREIELGLVRDDPDFVRRLRRLERADFVNVVSVFALLAVTAVLLVVGFATQSAWALVTGGLALVASFTVDDRYQRRFGSRSPG